MLGSKWHEPTILGFPPSPPWCVEAQVEAATAAVRVEQDRYRLGAGTLYDVASAQTRLAESLAGRAQAAYGLAFRRVLVRLAVGDVDPGALAGMLE